MWSNVGCSSRISASRMLILCTIAVVSVGLFWLYTNGSGYQYNGPVEVQELADEEQWPFGEKYLCQSDPELVNLIKEKYTIPPPEPEGGEPPQPSFWGNPKKTKYSKFGIVEEKLIPLLFHDEHGQPMREGTFLESGSLGSHLSATLYLERFLGWDGLIAEMVPLHIENIMGLTRYNSMVVPACVAPVPWPMKTTYTTGEEEKTNPFATLLEPKYIDDGKDWANTQEKKEKLHIGIADCFPLFSILLATNFTRIDFANLSFGGLEYEVLQTIPFDKVDIKVILFSLNNVNRQPPLIHKFMLKHGYIQVPPKLFIVRNRDPLYVRRDWAIERKFSFV